MKTGNYLRILGVLIGLALGLTGSQPAFAQDDLRGDDLPGNDLPGNELPVESFYDELEPYGQWVDTPEYGRVWIPEVESDFQPYSTRGHWVMTDYGNTWVSDYAWGWAPFHYGRWYHDRYRGWAWVPGREWGPAWVSWRTGGGYYGWAPLSPGISINVSVNIPSNYWCFVPQMYITSPYIYRYYAPRPRVVNIYRNTTIINNVYRYNNRSYYCGPRRNEIEYVTRRSVPVYRVNHVDRRGRSVIDNDRVSFYRPSYSGNARTNDRRDRNDGRYGADNRREYADNNRYSGPRANGARVNERLNDGFRNNDSRNSDSRNGDSRNDNSATNDFRTNSSRPNPFEENRTGRPDPERNGSTRERYNPRDNQEFNRINSEPTPRADFPAPSERRSNSSGMYSPSPRPTDNGRPRWPGAENSSSGSMNNRSQRPLPRPNAAEPGRPGGGMPERFPRQNQPRFQDQGQRQNGPRVQEQSPRSQSSGRPEGFRGARSREGRE